MRSVIPPLVFTATFTLPVLSSAEEYNQLPPPISALRQPTSYMLYLRLSVNGNLSPELVPVLVKDQHYFIDSGVLRKNHFPVSRDKQHIDVNRLAGVTVDYNSAAQQLNLRVPDSWLPTQYLTQQSDLAHLRPVASRGLLLNYDSYSQTSQHTSRSTSTYLEARLFGHAGTFSQSGIWRITDNGMTQPPRGYLRYDTQWKYSDTQRLISYQAGDFISNSLTWSHSVRMAGLRISRDFSVRPDLVTYPLLNLSGSAAVPGTVDLFINGYKASRNTVNAGPYNLTDVPFINGAGQATVVTTDALGRQVSTTLPFYVSNTLLAKGLSDFDMSAGVLRRNYGLASDDYGSGAISTIYRYGINNHLTASFHGEGDSQLMLAGTGTDITPGNLGTLSLSVSHSKTPRNYQGNQYTAGWSYYSTYWGLNLQHIRTDNHYSDLSDDGTASQTSRQSDQATLSLSPPIRNFGTVGLAYFAIRAGDSSETRLGNLSWSHSLGSHASLGLSLNDNFSQHSVTGALQLLVSWGSNNTLNSSTEQLADHKLTQRFSYSHTAPLNGGLGWTLSRSLTQPSDPQAAIKWVNRYSTLSTGVYQNTVDHSQWLEASGSVVAMDNDLFFSRSINDAFIIADTSGFPGAEVSYENRQVGTTDKHGHILIPWVSSWYPGKLTLNPLNFPADTEIMTPEKKIAVRGGSGAIVRFDIKRVRSALITFVDQSNTPLPPGTSVLDDSTGNRSVIGYGGQAWLSHLGRHNKVSVEGLPVSCQVVFDLPEVTHVPAEIGPVRCRYTSTPGE